MATAARRRTGPADRAVWILLALVLAGLGAWAVLGDDGDDDEGAVRTGAPASATAPGSEASSPATTVSTTVPPTTVPATTTEPPASTTTAARATTTTTVADRATGTSAPPAPARPGDTTAGETGTAPLATMPDGSFVPVLAVFDVDHITLTGAVPDQAARERLAALAVANAKPGQETIDDQVTIDPRVPRSIGVRVVELTSARFAEGTSEIAPAHAAELDRVVTVMQALPEVTALVIGHADQRGDEATNYRLSADRAEAVVDYLVSKGVAAHRLASRAVGEADLLTLADDDAALALNRRTEFVFAGLLLGS